MKITMDTTFQEIRDAINSTDIDDIENNEFKPYVDKMYGYIKKEKIVDIGAFHFLIVLITGEITFGKAETLLRKYNTMFYGSDKTTGNQPGTLKANVLSFLQDPNKQIPKGLKQELKTFSNKHSNSTLFDLYNNNIDIKKDNGLKELHKFHLFESSDLSRNLAWLNYAIQKLCKIDGGNEMPTQTQPTAPAKTNDPTVTDYIAKCIETSRKKNIIFTGAPGTGKTYSVEKFVNKQNYKQSGLIYHPLKKFFKFVQFHGSYDYTDFVEGLRPIERGDKMIFVRMDGTFKALCREAAKVEKENGKENGKEAPTYYFVIDEINRAELSKVFGELMYCFEKRGSDHKVQTQYHNLPTYGETENGIEKLSNDIFKDGFYVPENVVIIGTMNDIDRNVETFDFALRRRFDWIPIKANDFMETSLSSMLGDEDISKNLAQRAINMNKVISGESGKRFGLNEDYHIGPAYFKDYDKSKSMDENLDDIWKHNIEPILREYLRGKNGVDKFIDDCHTALMPKKDTATNEPQTTAEDEE